MQHRTGPDTPDWTLPKREVFDNAAAVLIKEAEDAMQLQPVESLVKFGNEMGSNLSELWAATHRKNIL
jgi:hypothetical protein